MSLFHAAARTLLASHFVVSGFKAVKDPQALVPEAKPLTDRFVPLVKQSVPESVAQYVPEDALTLVRINGALELAGGLMLASGRGRRLGALLLAASLIPTTLAKYPFWQRATAEEKEADKAHFLKNMSLLGGVLVASMDTEGKPSLAWRAQKGSQSIARDTKKTGQKVAKESRELTEAALAEGAALVGAVVATSRRAKKKAAKQFVVARAAAEKQAIGARKAADKAAKQASKDAQKFAKTAKKEARRQIAAAKDNASKVAANIRLGEN